MRNINNHLTIEYGREMNLNFLPMGETQNEDGRLLYSLKILSKVLK